MQEYQECLNHLINTIRLLLQREAGQQILQHRTRARGLQNIAGMDDEIRRHRYMVEFWERAARDCWAVFQAEIRELRDNG